MGDRLINLAVVVKSLDPDKGGHEYYINRLLRELLKKGYRIWCFGESFGTRSLEDANLTKIRIMPLKLESGLRLLWFNRRARRLVESHPIDFDLVFTTGNVTFGDVYRAGGGVHESYMENCLGRFEQLKPKHLVAKYLQRKLFVENTPKVLITNSEMVMKDIQRRFEVPVANLKVVRNGIDLSRFNPKVAGRNREAIRREHGFDDDDFVCLFTAGGGGRKGLSELLSSFATIENQSVKLLIVGRTDASMLQETVTSYGLDQRVVYAGYQPQIEKFYGAADCFVFPSKYDAAANVVCEALASGVPVITTRTNGSSEFIEEGENGFVIGKASDLEEMRDCIEKLAGCDDLLKMRERAAETGQKYSMDRHIVEFEGAISDYLRSQGIDRGSVGEGAGQ